MRGTSEESAHWKEQRAHQYEEHSVSSLRQSLIQSFYSVFMIESACRAYEDKEELRERILPLIALN